MAYIDQRLPESVELGSRGGPQFSTSIVQLMSGREARNQNWELARIRRDVGYPIRTRAEMEAVIAHYYVMRGNFHSFPFRDWSDYQVADELVANPTASAAPIQLTRTYGAGTADPYVRPITKLDGSPSITLGGAPVTEGVDYTVDPLTGIVTPLAPWTGEVRWTGNFLVPVRFDVSDETLAIVAHFEDGMSVEGLEVIEELE